MHFDRMFITAIHCITILMTPKKRNRLHNDYQYLLLFLNHHHVQLSNTSHKSHTVVQCICANLPSYQRAQLSAYALACSLRAVAVLSTGQSKRYIAVTDS